MTTAPHPLLTIHYRDPDHGFEGFAVIDSLVDGRAAGGVRVTETLDMPEVMALAQAMTRKLRVVDLPLGGAKYGIRFDPASPDKVAALTSFFQTIRSLCDVTCGFGPDMGTSPADCDAVARNIGMKTRHAALAAARADGETTVERYHQVLEAPVGPLTVLEARTGVGVAAATESAVAELDLPRPSRIAVQGFGQVGRGAAWYLHKLGHKIVGVADLGGYYRNPDGLDVVSMVENLTPSGLIDSTIAPRAGEPDDIYDEACDALVLAAQSFSVTEENVDRIVAKLVVEGGNLAVTPEAEEALTRRSIPVVPDFLTNGGAIAVVGGVILLGWETDDPEVLLGRIRDRIARTVTEVVRHARSTDTTMRAIALERFD